MSMEEQKEKRTDAGTPMRTIQSLSTDNLTDSVPQSDTESNPRSAIKVLGHTDNDQIVLYKNGKVYLRDVNRFTVRSIQLFYGVDEQAAKWLYKELPIIASSKEIDAENKIKNGIFKLSDNDEDEEQEEEEEGNNQDKSKEQHEEKEHKKTTFTIVNGTKSFQVIYGLGYKVVNIVEPIVNGKLINATSEPWINVKVFKKALEENAIDLLTEQYEEIARTLDAWCFESLDMQLYLTAFIMLAPFHIIMDWRPYLWITGAKETGKTNIFEIFLKGIYHGLTKSYDNPTDFSLAQSLSNTGLIPLLDNFEPSEKTQLVLKNCEITNKGGNYTRGTTGQEERTYRLNHMLWFNSVLVVPERAATDSRIVEFRLKAPPKRIVKLPETVSVSKIVAGLINVWDDLEDLKNIYISTNENNGRAAENVAYAHALLQLLDMFEKPGDEDRLPDFVIQRSQVNEGLDVLNTIFKYSILPDGATDSYEASKNQVFKILKDDLSYKTRSIIRKGLWPTTHKKQKYIALDSDLVVETILKNTRFRDYTPDRLEKVLLNMRGVLKTSVNGDNTTIRSILIPINYLEDVAKQNEEQEQGDKV